MAPWAAKRANWFYSLVKSLDCSHARRSCDRICVVQELVRELLQKHIPMRLAHLCDLMIVYSMK